MMRHDYAKDLRVPYSDRAERWAMILLQLTWAPVLGVLGLLYWEVLA
jgi:hypothetical protein